MEGGREGRFEEGVVGSESRASWMVLSHSRSCLEWLTLVCPWGGVLSDSPGVSCNGVMLLRRMRKRDCRGRRDPCGMTLHAHAAAVRRASMYIESSTVTARINGV